MEMYVNFFNGFITFIDKCADSSYYLEFCAGLIMLCLVWFIRNLILYI